jgi:hypothetical protein
MSITGNDVLFILGCDACLIADDSRDDLSGQPDGQTWAPLPESPFKGEIVGGTGHGGKWVRAWLDTTGGRKFEI